MIFDFLYSRKCNHNRIPANIEAGYCPDCGEYVENRWYIVRCKHCGIKRTAHALGDSIVPESKFCPNCGGFMYQVEHIKKINFIDINFAVLKKEIVQTAKTFSAITTWVEDEDTNEQKLIGISN